MTAPNTNTPRDGLSDADIEHVWSMQEGFQPDPIRFARAVIAADREARPAPASVEALIERWAGDDKIESPFNACQHKDYCLTLKAAASTPPAEAQPIMAGSDPATGSDERPRGTATPPASEARATGDAAELAVDKSANLQVDKTAEMQSQVESLLHRLEEHCELSDDSQYGTLSTGFVRVFIRDIRAALSDRSTGAVPAGFALVPIQPTREMNRLMADEGWEWAELLAAAEAITEDEYARASAPPADIERLRDEAKGWKDLVWHIAGMVNCLPSTFVDANEHVFKAIARLAATGAAGEPQPREGWKLVPVEPTEAMIHAAAQTPGMKAIDAASAIHQLRGNPISPAVFKAGSPLEQAWAAMLAAVPQADSGAAGERCPQCPHPSACQVHDECLKRSAGGQGDKP